MAAKKKDDSVSEKDNQRRQTSDQAIAAVFKATKQKPLGAQEGTWPYHSSGVIQVDNLIGGTPLPGGIGMVCPGYPQGRMVEIYGAESSGKTTLALAAVKEIQKRGRTAVYLDFENTLHHGYARACGVNFSKDYLHLYAPTTFEEGMTMIYMYSKMKFDLIVIDSVASMVPEAEMAKDLSKPDAIGLLARSLSSKLPRIVQWLKESPTTILFLNQTRSTIAKGPSYGVPEDNTSGGKALKFYMSVRLKITRIKMESVERPDPISGKKKKIPFGNVVQIKVVKNKMDGKQGHTGEIFIRYGYGVDEYLGLIESALPRKIIVQNGSSYSYGGETFKGRDKVRRYLMDNPKAFEMIRDKVVQALVASAPHAIEDAEDDEIVADTRSGLGDDELLETLDEEALDAVVEEAMA
jgi:recombination protein RecA